MLTLERSGQRVDLKSAIDTSDPNAASSAREKPQKVYDLKRGGRNSNEFYSRLEAFSARVLLEAEFRAGPFLDGYSSYLRTAKHESQRSRGEYALELLTLGMAFRLYASAAARTPDWVVALAMGFLHLRRRSLQLKPAADFARGCLFRFGFAAPKESCEPELLQLERMLRLVRWMQATGEFDQETVRLHLWHEHLLTMEPRATAACLRTSVDFFDWFSVHAANTLGSYTSGVRPFLGTEFLRRGIREDRLFCGRKPVEYHLGMVSAEVMNEGLRAAFEKTSQRALLVPACMRGKRADRCMALVHGLDITCTGCDPGCTVHRISRRLRAEGVPVFVVPHATGFSRWLERWQQEPDVGVVALACVLNILPGGYEMRDRGIPSQCLPLDYPGCQKHWCRQCVPTTVNEERLVRIVTAGRTASVPA